MEGWGKCARLCTIFVVSGLLCVTSLARIFTHSATLAHLLEMMMMVLTVLLVCLLVESYCKPLSDAPHSRASTGSSSSRGSRPSTRDPLVYAEAPPSYEEVVAAESLEDPSGSSHEDQAAGKTIPGTFQHSLTPTPYILATAGSGITCNHISLPRRYSPFIPESMYSYSSSSEIQLAVGQLPVDQLSVDQLSADQLSVDQLSVDQLSVDQLPVDGLPSYEEAVAVLQTGASTQHQVNTNHDMNLMFI